MPGSRQHGAGSNNSKEFNAHFRDTFQRHRWPTLEAALLQPAQLIALENGFACPGHEEEGLASDAALQAWLSCDGCRAFRRLDALGPPYPTPWLNTRTGLRALYWLDAASLLPALLLNVRPGMAVLDMCASPGGKSLVLAQQLWRLDDREAAQQPTQAPRATPSEAVPPTGTPSDAAAGTGVPSATAAATGDRSGAIGAAGTSSEATAAGATSAPPTTASSDVHTAAPTSPLADADTTDADITSPTSSATAVQSGTRGAPGVPHTAPFGKGTDGVTHNGGRPSMGSLTCNEPDAKRRQRLQGVLQEYLPAALVARVRVTAYEGDKHFARHEAETYDCVLIDAPCSSDRHILQQSAANRGVIPAAQWSVRGCKKMADLQLQLLLAGLKCLKVGGRLVYSTCSMSPLENDGVVDRLLARLGPGVAEVVGISDYGVAREVLQELGAEPTKHGALCLPDTRGWGPIWACVLKKHKAVPRAGGLQLVQVVAAEGQQEEDSAEEGADDCAYEGDS